MYCKGFPSYHHDLHHLQTLVFFHKPSSVVFLISFRLAFHNSSSVAWSSALPSIVTCFPWQQNLLVVCALRVVISTGCRQNQALVDSSCDHDRDAVLLEQLVFLYPNFLDSYDFDQCYLFSHRQTWQQQTSAEDFVFWCAIHGFWFLHHYLKRKYPFCFVSYRKIHCGGFLTLTFFRFLCTNVEDGCKEESCSSSNPREVLFRKELINPLTSRID